MKKATTLLCSGLLLLGMTTQASAAMYVGGHMMFTFYQNRKPYVWGTDIDVVNVWEVTQGTNTQGQNTVNFSSFISIDPPSNNDGIPGVPMVDGPFSGYSASFDFMLTQTDNTNWDGNGRLTMYNSAGIVVNPSNQDPNVGFDEFSVWWNGELGPTGAYSMTQGAAKFFQKWNVTNITTFVDMDGYAINDIVIPTKSYYYAQNADGTWVGDLDHGGSDTRVYWDPVSQTIVDEAHRVATPDIVFSVPGATAVPEPASMLLIGAGVAGLVGMRRRK